MKRIYFLGALGVIFILTSSFATKISLEKKSLLDDKIELKIPSDFKIMSKEILKMKYPSENRPELVYTNETGGINVAFTISTSKASQETLDDHVDQLARVFKSTSSIKWKGDGVRTINDRKVGYMEFVTPAIDTEIYNLMFFTDLDGQLLLCSFNCVKKSVKAWKPTAQEIMNSLVIK